MKKAKFWFLLSGVLAAVFVLKLSFDYHTYCTTLNSAPFWVWILVNAIYFLLPALIAFLIGWILKRK